MNRNNPYPTGSVSAMLFDKWSAATTEARTQFMLDCEAAPAGAMHGALANEWDVVSRISFSSAEYSGPVPAAVWHGDF